jgi:HSP20 family molecular chaperone IbpA
MINMRCPKCGAELKEGWKFCPRCGSRLGRDMFTDVFSRMEREMKEMGRMFERDFEVLDISPFFRKPIKGSGFSIKISRRSNEKPEVSVKTFGDVDRRGLEQEIGKLGIRETPKTEKPEVEGEGGVCLESAKRTEEPETCVRRIGEKIVVEVRLPGVNDSKDIEVKPLENSVEVKAMAGEKAYFKILTKPPQTNVVSKRFKNGVLYLELA